MWHPEWGGVPPQEFLSALDPIFDGYRERLFDETETADKPVGKLCKSYLALCRATE